MRLLATLARTFLLVLLVAAGTLALVRYAPGYFSDAREMDAQYGASALAQMQEQRAADRSSRLMAQSIVRGWLHGQLGTSRQYRVPVEELIAPRLGNTARLVGGALALGWMNALALALVFSRHRTAEREAWITGGSALLLAIPVGALATVFLLSDTGGPIITIAVVLCARDFKFLYRLLRREWGESRIVHARAQGLRGWQILLSYLLRPLWPELASLASMSLVLALSLAVPAEVLFDVPGIGQLAWSAAMNRDLPLLLAVTLIMAAAVGFSGLVPLSPALLRSGAEAS